MSRRPLLAIALAGAAAFLLPGGVARADGGAPAPAFAQPRALPLGAGITDPRALAVTDLDGDARLDLVAASANGATGAISVLRGTASGTFATPLGSPFDLGGTPGGAGALAVGDVNGDGRPDVVAAVTDGTVNNDELVPLAGDGTGALSPEAPVNVPAGNLAGVALADLDGDGDLDALTASTTSAPGDQLSTLENTGAAGLVATQSAGPSGTLLATALAVGDLDGDGTPDALVVSRGTGSGGSAWVATNTNLTLTPLAGAAPVGADPVAAVLADVDGDGDLDGVVLDGSAPQLTLLTNDGTGHLTASTIAVPGLNGGTGLAAGDLNGDGVPDLVVTDGDADAIGVLAGDGTGGFAAPSWTAAGAGPRAPVVADLTGDGRPDVAVADNASDTLSLLRNAGAPAPAATVAGGADLGTEAVGRTGAARTVTVTNTGTASLRITSVATAGDAADDVLITGDACTGTTVASGGAACTVRVRFAPSAAGARVATLRIRHADGTYDLALTGTGADTAVTPSTTLDTDSTPTAATTTAALVPVAVATPAAKARDNTNTRKVQPSAKKKTARLILTLSLKKLAAATGRPVKVGFALGRAAAVTLRVKQHGRTTAVIRAKARGGRGSITWNGRLGAQPAPPGTYRLDLFAVAADGRAARASITLTVK